MHNTAKQFDVVVIGGASIDTFLFPDDPNVFVSSSDVLCVKVGAKIPINYMKVDIGGGGANLAVGLSRHKISTTLITRIGNDESSNIILNKLGEEYVDTSFIKRGMLNTGQSVIIQGISRDRTIFTYRGTNSEVTVDDIPFDVVKNANYLLVNTLYGESSNLLNDIVEKIEGVKIVISLGVNEITILSNKLHNILSHVDTLVLNEEEAKVLYHTLLGSYHAEGEKCEKCGIKSNDLLNYFKSLGIKNVGITLGASGLKFIDESGKIYSIPSCSAEVVNTTGLGDAFLSGYLSYRILGKDTKDSLLHGIVNSVSVMSFPGAQTGLLKG